MEDEFKSTKKKRSKKGSNGDLPKGLEALAKFTSSDIIRQVKAGMSRIAPLEPEGNQPLTLPEEPTQ